MDKNAILKIISKFQKAIESKGIRINKIILFGSCAANSNREDSDIDLVVISRDFSKKGYWKRIDILSDAIYEVFEPIEAIALTPEEWNRRKSIIVDFAKNGEVVYG